MHQNARLTPYCRELLVARVLAGRCRREVARELGVSEKTVQKWVGRFQREGIAGLRDRSSRPSCSPAATAELLELAVVALRRQHQTLAMIAAQLVLSRSSVARMCRRAGLSPLSQLELAPHDPRYERAQSGRILRVSHRITGQRTDTHREAGWEYVHVVIDDCSRVTYCQVLPDEEWVSASAFLRAAVAYYAKLRVKIREVLTDNGDCYRAKNFAATCSDLRLKHRRMRPYTPRTNGKAERFIQSAVREWTCARAYGTSAQRINALPRWLGGTSGTNVVALGITRSAASWARAA